MPIEPYHHKLARISTVPYSEDNEPFTADSRRSGHDGARVVDNRITFAAQLRQLRIARWKEGKGL